MNKCKKKSMRNMLSMTLNKFCEFFNSLFATFYFCIQNIIVWIGNLFSGCNMASRRGPKAIEKLVEVMIPLFDLHFEQDDIILNHGEHEIFVPTKGRVKRVWFTFTDVRYIPICQGSADMCGVTIRPDGFIIHASIKSEYRGIRYFAVVRHQNDHRNDEEEDGFEYENEELNRLM